MQNKTLSDNSAFTQLLAEETHYVITVSISHLLRMMSPTVTGWAQLIRSHSSARFSFELSGNSNYIIHCNSNYVQNFELEINSI